MKNNDLKKLSRTELLELLIEQASLNEDYKKQIADLQRQLDDRLIIVSDAGSIAEASLKVQGVYEAAQRAADQYLKSTIAYCENLKKEASVVAESIIVQAIDKKRGQ